MRVAIIGSSGQLGSELAHVLRMVAKVVPLTRHQLDLTNSKSIVTTLDEVRPDVVVNCGAITAVDAIEKDEATALAVNGTAVGVLGELATKLNFGLVHFSTNSVYDGDTDGAYTELDVCNPLNAYGRTKLRGDEALLSMDAPALIVRTAWLYSIERRSFVSAMLRKAREVETMRVVTDVRSNPIYCRDLAETVALVLYRAAPFPRAYMRQYRGVYHVANEGACSKYELVLAALALDPNKNRHKVRDVLPITTADTDDTARRPRNTELNCTKFETQFDIICPTWQSGLERCLTGRYT